MTIDRLFGEHVVIRISCFQNLPDDGPLGSFRLSARVRERCYPLSICRTPKEPQASIVLIDLLTGSGDEALCALQVVREFFAALSVDGLVPHRRAGCAAP